jgi:hypothetical protein
VIEKRHEYVPRVPRHDEVLHVGVIRQAVERQVRLEEPPVCLCFEHLIDVFERNRHEAGIYPGRYLQGWQFVGISVKHLQQDILREGGSGLVGGGHYDVAVARLIAIPTFRVEMMVLVDVLNGWQWQCDLRS